MLCPLARHFILRLILFQPRKRFDMTEKLLTGTSTKFLIGHFFTSLFLSKR